MIGLRDELAAEDPLRELGVGRDGVGGLIPRNLGDIGSRVGERCAEVRFGFSARQRRGAGQPVGKHEFRVELPDRCLYAVVSSMYAIIKHDTHVSQTSFYRVQEVVRRKKRRKESKRTTLGSLRKKEDECEWAI